MQSGGDLYVNNATTINANGTLSAGGNFTSNVLTINGGMLTIAANSAASATTVTTSGAATISGPGTLGSGGLPVVNFTVASGTTTFGGGITANITTLTINGAANLGPGSTIISQGISARRALSAFNGGTLRTTGSGTLVGNLAAALVQAGGVAIDSNGYSTAISQSFAHDPGLGATPDGGLTKIGAGTLMLTAAQNYTGPTLVAAGTLSLPYVPLLGYVGTQFDLGSGWRTASVGKTFGLNGSNVLGNDGYIVIGNNSRMLQPGYISTMIVNGGIYGGNAQYASIDDPSTTLASTPPRSSPARPRLPVRTISLLRWATRSPPKSASA